ncbi:hypothetical protein ACFVSS_26985 [Peribacillus butanolivorans]|uniref:hypothetical protein n=1 Tax=Peribacillus butanolivorans TaxID=421767 RepID=UPI0036DDDD7F
MLERNIIEFYRERQNMMQKDLGKPNHGSIFFIKPIPLVLVHPFTNYIKEGFY